MSGGSGGSGNRFVGIDMVFGTEGVTCSVECTGARRAVIPDTAADRPSETGLGKGVNPGWPRRAHRKIHTQASGKGPGGIGAERRHFARRRPPSLWRELVSCRASGTAQAGSLCGIMNLIFFSVVPGQLLRKHFREAIFLSPPPAVRSASAAHFLTLNPPAWRAAPPIRAAPVIRAALSLAAFPGAHSAALSRRVTLIAPPRPA